MPTKTEYQLDCPYPADDWKTPACETPQAATAWLTEHFLDNHAPGRDRPEVQALITQVKAVTGRFK